MANKIANFLYDQIPHIVLEHPETKSDHICLMIHLFKVLKDNSIITYSNEKLSKNSKISLRTVERKITELQKMGFINCFGRGFNRRISLGILFNNTAILAVESDKKIDNTAKIENTTAKNDIYNRHSGGDSKSYNKHYNNDNFPNPQKVNPQAQDKAHERRMKEYEEIIKRRK